MINKIKNLNMGESIVIDGLTVKRVKRNEYTAFAKSDERHRWGNLNQIIDDAEHYTQTGTLPHAKVSWC